MPSNNLLRFLLASARVRGEIVRIDSEWQALTLRQKVLPNFIRQQLGELTAAALLLSATLKFDGTVILQIQGDGPVAFMVVECESDNSFRSTVTLRAGQEELAAQAATLKELVNVNGQGRFALTLAPKSSDMSPYQGLVSLVADNLAGALEDYLRQSEQIPSFIRLAANDSVACGLLLQHLPPEGGIETSPSTNQEDTWQHMTTLARTITAQELLDVPSEEILHRLYWEQSLGPIESRSLRFQCRCSAEKVKNMLRMLGKAEVESVIAERGDVEIHCEFCNQKYVYDAVDAKALFLEPSSIQEHPNAPQ